MQCTNEIKLDITMHVNILANFVGSTHEYAESIKLIKDLSMAHCKFIAFVTVHIIRVGVYIRIGDHNQCFPLAQKIHQFRSMCPCNKAHTH